jgi:hypothetical protein
VNIPPCPAVPLTINDRSPPTSIKHSVGRILPPHPASGTIIPAVNFHGIFGRVDDVGDVGGRGEWKLDMVMVMLHAVQDVIHGRARRWER